MRKKHVVCDPPENIVALRERGFYADDAGQANSIATEITLDKNISITIRKMGGFIGVCDRHSASEFA
jgi:hypothetical protein